MKKLIVLIVVIAVAGCGPESELKKKLQEYEGNIIVLDPCFCDPVNKARVEQEVDITFDVHSCDLSVTQDRYRQIEDNLAHGRKFAVFNRQFGASWYESYFFFDGDKGVGYTQVHRCLYEPCKSTGWFEENVNHASLERVPHMWQHCDGTKQQSFIFLLRSDGVIGHLPNYAPSPPESAEPASGAVSAVL